MEETVHDLNTKIRQRKKSMTTSDKYEVERSFNLKKPRNNIMYNFFYSNIPECAGNLEEIIDEGTYKKNIQNMHKIGWKAQLFKSDYVSILGHGCGVSQYPQFYEKNKNRYKMLPRSFVGSYLGEKGHYFFQEKCICKVYSSIFKEYK